MPKVNGKEYPYTPEGMANAKRAQQAAGAADDLHWNRVFRRRGQVATADRREREGQSFMERLDPNYIPEGGGRTDVPAPTMTVPIGPKDNQRFVNIELLVEGQRNIKGILRGDKPTAEQEEIAMEAAMERFEAGEQLPEFDTYEAARKAATQELYGPFGEYTPDTERNLAAPLHQTPRSLEFWDIMGPASERQMSQAPVTATSGPRFFDHSRRPTKSQIMRGGTPEGTRKILAEEMPHKFNKHGYPRDGYYE